METIKLSGTMKEINLKETLESKEINIRIDKELEEATFSCGYATTCNYIEIKTKEDLAEALKDYLGRYEIM